MAGAVRVVTARRGHDPRRLALVSFGGAGGLHACAVAELLGMRTVILPPMAGVLSALGMVAAGDSVDVSQTVLPLEREGALDDGRLAAEFARLDDLARERLPEDGTATVEALADCRWDGQSHELTIRAAGRDRSAIEHAFAEAYRTTYGPPPPGRAVQIVTLRLRRSGPAPEIALQPLEDGPDTDGETELVDNAGNRVRARSIRRSAGLVGRKLAGPLLLIDPDATAFIPKGWSLGLRRDGIAIATHEPRGDEIDDLTEEDEAILDNIWKQIAQEG
jgi:N-methylhydantoinase A